MPEAPDWDALYRDHIHPALAVPQGGQDWPRCVFVTGPQGSGKTTILRRLSAELGHDVTQSIVPDARHWQAEPFAVESLLVERARPRSDAALAALLADWTALHQTIAAENQPAWPPQDLHAFDRHLRDLLADPASRFDLTNPDPAAAPGWIARLTADLAAVRASPEVNAQPGLAPRADRLIALVSQLCGQPTR